MKTIELDSANWNSLPDFGSAVHSALGAPPGYSNSSIDALLEAIYWDHAYAGLNRGGNKPYRIDPPFTLKVINSTQLPKPSVMTFCWCSAALTKPINGSVRNGGGMWIFASKSPDDAASDVKLSEIVALIAADFGIARQNAGQLEHLQKAVMRL